MAIRRDELVEAPGAVVVPFPTELVRARAARRRVLATRRRLALSAGAVVVAATVLLAGSGDAAVASAPGAPDAVVLRQGDTLWDVAVRYAAEGSDPRAYVYALEQLNGLSGPPPAGLSLHLPK